MHCGCGALVKAQKMTFQSHSNVFDTSKEFKVLYINILVNLSLTHFLYPRNVFFTPIWGFLNAGTSKMSPRWAMSLFCFFVKAMENILSYNSTP